MGKTYPQLTQEQQILTHKGPLEQRISIANQFAKYQTESFENGESEPPLEYYKSFKLLCEILAV